MAYDQAFFDAYATYIREPSVRKSHNTVFDMVDSILNLRTKNVLDLGCGAGEYRRFGSYRTYTGVDRQDWGTIRPNIKGDYTDPAILSQVQIPPDAFVSLFSVEACLDLDSRYALYRSLFQDTPRITCGISAGFYYQGRQTEPRIAESGDITSYQTIDAIGERTIPDVTELRITIETPSTMFGPDVVEVWKVFTSSTFIR